MLSRVYEDARRRKSRRSSRERRIRVSVHSNVGRACARNILDGPDVLRPSARRIKIVAEVFRVICQGTSTNRTIKARFLRDTLCPFPKSALLNIVA